MSRPSTVTAPSSTVAKPAIIISVVVLPEPDGPEQRKELAGKDVEGYLVDHAFRAVALGHGAQPDGAFAVAVRRLGVRGRHLRAGPGPGLVSD